MKKIKVLEMLNLNTLSDNLQEHIRNTEREIAELRKRLIPLECPHTITDIERKWAGHSYYVEICKSCRKILKSVTEEEYHKIKYESLMKQAAEHKKFLAKDKKKKVKKEEKR